MGLGRVDKCRGPAPAPIHAQTPTSGPAPRTQCLQPSKSGLGANLQGARPRPAPTVRIKLGQVRLGAPLGPGRTLPPGWPEPGACPQPGLPQHPVLLVPDLRTEPASLCPVWAWVCAPHVHVRVCICAWIHVLHVCICVQRVLCSVCAEACAPYVHVCAPRVCVEWCVLRMCICMQRHVLHVCVVCVPYVCLYAEVCAPRVCVWRGVGSICACVCSTCVWSMCVFVCRGVCSTCVWCVFHMCICMQRRALHVCVCTGCGLPGPVCSHAVHRCQVFIFRCGGLTCEPPGTGEGGVCRSGSWRGPAHLQQLHLHVVAHEVGVLAALATLQVVSGNAEGHGRGVQGALQPLLLRQQQVGLGHQVVHLALQLRLPAVRVLQPLAHLLGGVLLRALGQRLRLGRQLPALVALPLRLVTVGEGLVVAGVAVLEPLVHQVLGRAEAGGGQARGRVGARVAGHIVQLAGQLACRHRLRGGLLGQEHVCLRHGAHPARSAGQLQPLCPRSRTAPGLPETGTRRRHQGHPKCI
uniref:Uncharacterized protein n=1 Tax=Equus caballus TaxID=9796 RepID=A0A3Q2IJ28_HORSE